MTAMRQCVCGDRLEPKVATSRAGSEVRWVCENQWADVEHGDPEKAERELRLAARDLRRAWMLTDA